MKINALAAVIVFVIAGSQSARAQTQDPVPAQPKTAKQIYDEYIFYSGLVATEVQGDLQKGGLGFPDSRPGTNFSKEYALANELHSRSEAGDVQAMFLEGLMKYNEGVKLARFPNGQGTLGDEDLRTSLALFKRAGDGGIPDGYYNAALQYQNGKGAIPSKLAAAEWFYRAGVAFLKAGSREMALASLEAIRANDRPSPYAKKLETALQAGAPR